MPMKILRTWTFRVTRLFWYAGLALPHSQVRKSQPCRSRWCRCVRFWDYRPWWHRLGGRRPLIEAAGSTVISLRRRRRCWGCHRSSSCRFRSTFIWLHWPVISIYGSKMCWDSTGKPFRTQRRPWSISAPPMGRNQLRTSHRVNTFGPSTKTCRAILRFSSACCNWGNFPNCWWWYFLQSHRRAYLIIWVPGWTKRASSRSQSGASIGRKLYHRSWLLESSTIR